MMKKFTIHRLTKPIIALIAGLLILLFPESLVPVVGIYLVLIGAVGIFGKS